MKRPSPEKAGLLLFDTVVLSNFALVESLHLLEHLPPHSGAVTCEVLDEVASGVSKGYTALRTVESMVVSGAFEQVFLTPTERNSYTDLLRNLGSGEASCIAVAKERKGIVATDDLLARSICNQLGCSVTGTIGVLDSLFKKNVLSSAQTNELLCAMIQKGFYSPVKRI